MSCNWDDGGHGGGGGGGGGGVMKRNKARNRRKAASSQNRISIRFLVLSGDWRGPQQSGSWKDRVCKVGRIFETGEGIAPEYRTIDLAESTRVF